MIDQMNSSQGITETRFYLINSINSQCNARFIKPHQNPVHLLSVFRQGSIKRADCSKKRFEDVFFVSS